MDSAVTFCVMHLDLLILSVCLDFSDAEINVLRVCTEKQRLNAAADQAKERKR